MDAQAKNAGIVFGDETTPMREIQAAPLVVERETGAIVKNRYGRVADRGSVAAEAIRAAHAAYKATIGTDRETQAYAELERVVTAIAGSR